MSPPGNRTLSCGPYAGRITLIRSTAAVQTEDLYRGWNDISPSDVDLHLLNGIHHDLVREPVVQSLAAILQQCLDSSFSQ